jgi:hypothetical protein
MSDMSTDTTTPATDRELVQIEGKARATTVMHWPELVRMINRLRQAEAENDRLREALTSARTMLVAFGGDPRGSANGDEIQTAILDLIDAALAAGPREREGQ